MIIYGIVSQAGNTVVASKPFMFWWSQASEFVFLLAGNVVTSLKPLPLPPNWLPFFHFCCQKSRYCWIFQQVRGKSKPVVFRTFTMFTYFPALHIVRLHVCPRLVPVTYFPALGTGCIFSRALYLLHASQRLAPVACYSLFWLVVVLFALAVIDQMRLIWFSFSTVKRELL